MGPWSGLSPLSPISVTPPGGWTTSSRIRSSTDGYAIQFVATSPTYDVQPGSSMSFAFQNSDVPVGQWEFPFYPGTPVGTSVFTPARHSAMAVINSPRQPRHRTDPNPTPTPTSTSPVTITGVRLIENRKNVVTGIVVDFSGGVNVAEAENSRSIRSHAGQARGIRGPRHHSSQLRSASYDTALNDVTLTRRKGLVTKPVEFVVHAQPPGVAGQLGCVHRR